MADDTKRPVRQPIAPLRSDFPVRFHAEAQLEPLHDATLRLLETTGMRFESPKALAILKKAGAKADEGSALVRLPRRLVEETLARGGTRFGIVSMVGGRPAVTKIEKDGLAIMAMSLHERARSLGPALGVALALSAT